MIMNIVRLILVLVFSVFGVFFGGLTVVGKSNAPVWTCAIAIGYFALAYFTSGFHFADFDSIFGVLVGASIGAFGGHYSVGPVFWVLDAPLQPIVGFHLTVIGMAFFGLLGSRLSPEYYSF